MCWASAGFAFCTCTLFIDVVRPSSHCHRYVISPTLIHENEVFFTLVSGGAAPCASGFLLNLAETYLGIAHSVSPRSPKKFLLELLEKSGLSASSDIA